MTMLATDECINLDDYAFKSSPESCSGNSYSTDYTDLHSDEDFLQQLSSDLDIPLLLNPGEDELSLLNSFFDKSPDEIMSEIVSSPESNKFDEFSDEFGELQQLDMLRFQPDAFPNLQSHVKSEPTSSSSCSSSNKSESPLLFNDLKSELKVEPCSPSSITRSPTHKIDLTISKGSKPISLQANVQINKLPTKRVIQPKTPYVVPLTKSKVVVFKNGDYKFSAPIVTNGNIASSSPPKMMIFDNISRVPAKHGSHLIPTTIASSVPVRNTSTPVIINNNSITVNRSKIDPKILKRQQRKIKNRESACLSRKKKKDYLTSLENQVKDLCTENDQLRMKNLLLQERLMKYEGKSASPATSNKTGTVRNTIVLCMFLFSMGFHLDYLSNPFLSRNQVTESLGSLPKVQSHQGRNLLWAPDNQSDKNASNFLPLSMCPAAINQTESARLVLELERWIGKPGDPIEKNFPANETKVKVQKIKTKALRKKKLRTRLNNLIPTNPMYSIRKIPIVEVNNEIQVFSPSPQQLYSEFFEAINRKDDTFYVVLFSDHHMLLPALHHNKTSRPKMSLIMPSMLPNENVSQTSLLPVMQIDCEVLDTRLIQIRYASIPQHLRNQGNSTTYQTNDVNKDVSKSSDTANYTNKKAYKPYFIRGNSVKTNDDSDVYNLR